MRIVLDTNVLIAAFISRGVCAELLEHCIRQHQIVASGWILREYRGILREKFHYPASEVREAVAHLRTRLETVTPTKLPERVCRDPDDDPVLGTALAGGCQCIVTGDEDLLTLGQWEGIDIIRPSDFWRYEAARS